MVVRKQLERFGLAHAHSSLAVQLSVTF
jgi:hypothetical protein